MPVIVDVFRFLAEFTFCNGAIGSGLSKTTAAVTKAQVGYGGPSVGIRTAQGFTVDVGKAIVQPIMQAAAAKASAAVAVVECALHLLRNQQAVTEADIANALGDDKHAIPSAMAAAVGAGLLIRSRGPHGTQWSLA